MLIPHLKMARFVSEAINVFRSPNCVRRLAAGRKKPIQPNLELRPKLALVRSFTPPTHSRQFATDRRAEDANEKEADERSSEGAGKMNGPDQYEQMPPFGPRVSYSAQPKTHEKAKTTEKSALAGGITWVSCMLFLVVGGTIYYISRKRRVELEQARNRVESAGVARIGGPFSLVNHLGRPMTSADLGGKYSLIYFGFTFCPDICPYELRKMKKALDLLSPDSLEQVQPIMITVDPWRDSIERLNVYVQDYHPKLIGLTGTPEQIEQVSRRFRVYASKAPSETEDDYLVDHSVFMYLMGPEFKLADYYGIDMEPSDIAERIQSRLELDHSVPKRNSFQKLKNFLKSLSS